MWGAVGRNLASYRSYPRIVGETGGKDFVVAHPSADLDVLRRAKEEDERRAAENAGAQYAAGEDPYKKPADEEQ